MTQSKVVPENGVAKPTPTPTATTTATSTTTSTATPLVKPSAAGFGTLAVHAGSPHDATTGAVIEAISLSTTFAQSAVGQPVGAFEYSRSSNPNRANFEQAVAALEHARHALAFSSGSAATATVLQALAATGVGPEEGGGGLAGQTVALAAETTVALAAETTLLDINTPPASTASTASPASSASPASPASTASPSSTSSTATPVHTPSHIISVSDVYGGTHRYFTQVAKAHNIRVSFTPSLEADLASLIIPSATRLVWIETPSNPTLRLVDIAAVARVAHAHGVLVVVDNTFLSPYLQNPLDHGADVVVHSVTKYINGHSDVVMGIAACNRPDLHARLAFLQNAAGAVPSAFDSWLAHRGLKTLHLRARAAADNALLLARALDARPLLVRAVHYPGLDSHPQRHVALRQHRDGLGGGMLSFRLRAGPAAARRFCQLTRLFTLAESLGGIESLVEVPSSMTHAGIPRPQREAVGVFDDLVRVSCGIEDSADLLYDALQALERASDESDGLAL